jgi:hypothetical protein
MNFLYLKEIYKEIYGITLLSVCMWILHLLSFVRGLWHRLALCWCVPPNFYFFFYAASVVSKEIRRLVLPRTSCYIFCCTIFLKIYDSCLFVTDNVSFLVNYSLWHNSVLMLYLFLVALLCLPTTTAYPLFAATGLIAMLFNDSFDLGVTWFWGFVHRPLFYRIQHFGNWICFRPRLGRELETPTLLDPLERANLDLWTLF